MPGTPRRPRSSPPCRSVDEAVIIGRQGNDEVTADELAAKLDTINYEIVTSIAQRIPRVEA